MTNGCVQWSFALFVVLPWLFKLGLLLKLVLCQAVCLVGVAMGSCSWRTNFYVYVFFRSRRLLIVFDQLVDRCLSLLWRLV